MRTELRLWISRILSLFTAVSLLVVMLSVVPTHTVLGLGIAGTITRPGFLPSDQVEKS